MPHVYAPTDADAVFGLMYAQAEDDFNRIETNFLTSLGRMAEAEGEHLHTHAETQPMVLGRFEPWMALSFSERSIGGDIERVNLGRLEDFYGNPEAQMEALAKR